MVVKGLHTNNHQGMDTLAASTVSVIKGPPDDESRCAVRRRTDQLKGMEVTSCGPIERRLSHGSGIFFK